MAVKMKADLYGDRVKPSADRTADGSGNIISAYWSSMVNATFYRSNTFGGIVNRDWEGEIKDRGDTVYIKERPHMKITITGPKSDLAYAGAAIAAGDKSEKVLDDPYSIPDAYQPGIGIQRRFERRSMKSQKLSIDYMASWGLIDDDLIAYQSDFDYMKEFVEGASIDMAVAIDKMLLNLLPPEAHINNKGKNAGKISGLFNMGVSDDPVEISSRNILDFISDCGTVLDEQDVPMQDRFIVFSSALAGIIRKSDLRNASLSHMESSLFKYNTYGPIAGMTIFCSNQLTQTGDPGSRVVPVIFGQKSGVTFASQFNRIEGPMRHPYVDGDHWKGSSYFGWKTVKQEALGAAYVKAIQ